MVWSKISRADGIEAHHLLRWNNVPVAVIKKRKANWYCTVLCRSGIAVTPYDIPLSFTLPQVKEAVEKIALAMGWESKTSRPQDAPSLDPKKRGKGKNENGSDRGIRETDGVSDDL